MDQEIKEILEQTDNQEISYDFGKDESCYDLRNLNIIADLVLSDDDGWYLSFAEDIAFINKEDIFKKINDDYYLNILDEPSFKLTFEQYEALLEIFVSKQENV